MPAALLLGRRKLNSRQWPRTLDGMKSLESYLAESVWMRAGMYNNLRRSRGWTSVVFSVGAVARTPGEQRSWLGCAHVAALVGSGRVRTAKEGRARHGVLQRGDLQLR
jgi:hypothetical protein